MMNIMRFLSLSFAQKPDFVSVSFDSAMQHWEGCMGP